MSTLAVATIKSASSAAPVFQNSSGTEKGQLAKSWVNFQGSGTVGINDSFNVSSITDSGLGKYIVTMENAMANTNYAVVADIQGRQCPLIVAVVATPFRTSPDSVGYCHTPSRISPDSVGWHPSSRISPDSVSRHPEYPPRQHCG